MVTGPRGIILPPSFTLIEDADEEIFLLYTRKLSLRPSASQPTTTNTTSATSKEREGAGGLGFLSTSSEVLPISLMIRNPHPLPAGTERAGRKGRAARKAATRTAARKDVEKDKDKVVEFELMQDLDALRNRRGDTGSVLWRVSKHLAHHLLLHLSFPHPSLPPPLLPALFSPPSPSPSSPPHERKKLRVLELGAGTAFLGLALLPLLGSLHHDIGGAGEGGATWTFTDQLANLPLIARNLARNSARLEGDAVETEIREVDWLSPPSVTDKEDSTPDKILALDCLYNPSLSLPLLSTISALASPEPGRTVVVVASELRDEQALGEFLRGWMAEGGWEVGRVGFGEGGEGGEEQGGGGGTEGEGKDKGVEEGIAGREFVVWVGWRRATDEEVKKGSKSEVQSGRE